MEKEIKKEFAYFGILQIPKSHRSLKSVCANLAKIVKQGFDGNDKRFDRLEKEISQFPEENKKDHESFKKDFSDIRFRMTELVHRDEFLELKQEVDNIKIKLGMTK
jgi:hypothetical protein